MRKMTGDAYDKIQQRAGAGDSPQPKPTVRSRLLLAVNLPLAALLAVFLAYDYSRELGQRLDEKRIALEEEAKTMLPAVLQVRHHGAGSVQRYIDTVCGRMQDAESPGHHIAAELDGETFQAAAHHRASPEIMLAMRQAARSFSHRAPFGETELIVGSQQRDGATVYVSETLEDLRAAVMGDIVRRLVGFALSAMVVALVVNVVLVRIVSKPLDRLVGTVQQIGAGQLGTEAEPFSTAELDYLAGEINAMSNSLAAADRDRKAQMAKARDIQRNLLPHDIAAPEINVAHVFEPADDVGGDYYDILPLDDGAWLFCVADVTGHGVPAAMTAAMLKTLLLQAAESLASPAEMLRLINQRFTAVSLAGDFATMALVRAVPRAGSLTYASAGHEPPWLAPLNGQPRELPSTGLILGIDAEAAWEDVTIDMAMGDRLLIVTDGVSETFNREGKMFGRERLGGVLGESRDLSVEQAAGRINEALKDFRGDAAQTDDVTLVLFEIATNPQVGSDKQP
jgi:serine phosphatase RsbU (regulator of sigma subunit)